MRLWVWSCCSLFVIALLCVCVLVGFRDLWVAVVVGSVVFVEGGGGVVSSVLVSSLLSLLVLQPLRLLLVVVAWLLVTVFVVAIAVVDVCV